jgi:hypothetical protein
MGQEFNEALFESGDPLPSEQIHQTVESPILRAIVDIQRDGVEATHSHRRRGTKDGIRRFTRSRFHLSLPSGHPNSDRTCSQQLQCHNRDPPETETAQQTKSRNASGGLIALLHETSGVVVGALFVSSSKGAPKMS